MSDDSVQNYGNHVRYLPPWHFIVFPILLLNAILELKPLVQAPSADSARAALVALALVAGVFFSRWMALRVQDRLIRLEEMLRLERLMPGRYSEFERLSTAQLIALRFASDAEVAHMVELILAGELNSRDDIKRSVQHWRPDHLRI